MIVSLLMPACAHVELQTEGVSRRRSGAGAPCPVNMAAPDAERKAAMMRR